MVNQSPDYHEGFSKGFHKLPCEGARSAEFQAGWLDGKEQVESIERQIAQLDQELEDCDCE